MPTRALQSLLLCLAIIAPACSDAPTSTNTPLEDTGSPDEMDACDGPDCNPQDVPEDAPPLEDASPDPPEDTELDALPDDVGEVEDAEDADPSPDAVEDVREDAEDEPPPQPTEVCDNGQDDDSDRLVDCADADCIGAPECPEVFACAQGLDDDCDGVANGLDNCPRAFGRFVRTTPIGSEVASGTIAGDFDGDGALDAVLLGQRDQHFSRGDGAGGFAAPQVAIELGRLAFDGTAADFDEDGHLDLLLGTFRSADVWLGDGQGGFELGVGLVGTVTYHVETADLNRDGNEDAITYGFEGADVWLGDGQGGFSRHHIFDDATRSGAVGDFDGDGHLDIAVGGNRFDTLFTGDGRGGFTRRQAPLGADRGTEDMIAADLDGDGDDDLVFGHTFGPGRVWLQGPGGLQDTEQDLDPQGPPDLITEALAVADFDHDGDLDLLVAYGEAPGLVFINDGDGVFSDAGRLEGLTGQIEAIGTGDFDGDGRVDVLIPGRPPQLLTWQLASPDQSDVDDDGTGDLCDVETCDDGLDNDSDGDTDCDDFECGALPVCTGEVCDDGEDNDNDGEVDCQDPDCWPTPLCEGDLCNRQLDNDCDGLTDRADNCPDLHGRFVPTDQGFVTRNTYRTLAEDFNGDGHLDAFITTQGPNVLYLGQSDGTLTEAGSFGDEATFGAAAGDLDGDGDLDIYTANFDGPDRVWLGDGEGGFVILSEGDPERESARVAFGDFDEDGDLDAMLLGNAGNTLLIGDGEGGFEESGAMLGESGLGVALHDFNEDGHLDALIRHNTDSTLWFGDGQGGFEGPRLIIQRGEASVGDLNSDGHLDLLIPTSSDGLQRLLGDGQGNFVAEEIAPIPQANLSALADFNGDGHLDVYLVTQSALPDLTLFGDGQGNFERSPFSPPSVQSSGLLLADFNGDERPDALVTGSRGATRLNLWRPPNADQSDADGDDLGDLCDVETCGDGVDNEGDGLIDCRDPDCARLGCVPVVCTLETDADCDGVIDLEDNCPESHGRFVEASRTRNQFRANLNDVALVDIDADGHLDALLAVDRDINQIWLGDGAGNFTDSGQTFGFNGGDTDRLVLGDLDNDGLVDLISLNNTSAPSALFINHGGGLFTARITHINSRARDADIGDLNGDGLPDVVITRQEGLSLYLGETGGVFAPQLPRTDNQNSGVALGDLDGDGFDEAFISNGNPDPIWHLNDFDRLAPINSDFIASGNDVVLHDFNGDGALDAFTPRSQADRLYLGQGDGTFVESEHDFGEGNHVQVRLGDFNRDGRQDLFLLHGTGGSHRLWTSKGDGTFTDNEIFQGTVRGRGVALADIDNDGDLDALIADGELVVWLYSPSDPSQTDTDNDGRGDVCDLETCDDGLDNDGDGDVDCDDTSCSFEEICR